MSDTLEEIVPQDPVAAMMGLQEEVLELERFIMRRLFFVQPALWPPGATFGATWPAETTIPGDQNDSFAGVCILNPSAKTIYIGFAPGASVGGAQGQLFCPPYSGLVWPARFADLSLSVNASDAQGTATTAAVLRLRVPPQPNVFAYGSAASGASGSAAVLTVNSNNNFGVTNASQQLVPANPGRLGLEIQNNGANPVTLKLGAAPAVAGQGIVLAAGSSWNGRIGGNTLWAGAVQVIATVAGPTAVEVVEV